MMNRFQRCASNYAYYGYLQHYSPDQIRRYQSERHFRLGRRGAYNNLVLKYAADHINYEQDLNLKYKVPTFLTNLSMRLSLYWFGLTVLITCFYLGDMIKVFDVQQWFYPITPSACGEAPHRYETLYIVDRRSRY